MHGLFSDCLLSRPLFCGSEGKVWAQRPSYLSFSPPFLNTLKHNQDHINLGCTTLILGHVVWTKLGAPGMFQASPDFWVTSFLCGPALVFSLSASTDSIFLCFMPQGNSNSEDPNSLLLYSVNKNTLEGNNHFPPSFFPLSPFKNKIEAPGIAFLCRCHATTSSPDL